MTFRIWISTEVLLHSTGLLGQTMTEDNGRKRMYVCTRDWVSLLYYRKLTEHCKPAITGKIKIILKNDQVTILWADWTTTNLSSSPKQERQEILLPDWLWPQWDNTQEEPGTVSGAPRLHEEETLTWPHRHEDGHAPPGLGLPNPFLWIH